MNDGTTIWMIIFAVFALIFFVVAAIVSVKGIADIKDLMNDPDLNK
ncbi:MAG: hypothetical protein WD059_02790 [Balneolaceae bacterium]